MSEPHLLDAGIERQFLLYKQCKMDNETISSDQVNSY
jgi:hypothetical protein